ncbi:mitochondrial chaperone Frataxin [Xylariaceae sp. FL1019]|nr:mitochondrial chaperone Frataxin [Xylariaceae sp. FL1019]
MQRLNVTKVGRLTVRGLTTRGVAVVASRTISSARIIASQRQPAIRSPFSTTSYLAKPLSGTDLKTAQPADMTDAEYHELADSYLEQLFAQFERKAEESVAYDIDYSSGVMTVSIDQKGTYVINKQPPNKQIWLSSPISGPKRYDWVVIREGQDQKQDTATGDWVYIRDGSTLSELLKEEADVNMNSFPDGTI